MSWACRDKMWGWGLTHLWLGERVGGQSHGVTRTGVPSIPPDSGFLWLKPGG